MESTITRKIDSLIQVLDEYSGEIENTKIYYKITGGEVEYNIRSIIVAVKEIRQPTLVVLTQEEKEYYIYGRDITYKHLKPKPVVVVRIPIEEVEARIYGDTRRILEEIRKLRERIVNVAFKALELYYKLHGTERIYYEVVCRGGGTREKKCLCSIYFTRGLLTFAVRIFEDGTIASYVY